MISSSRVREEEKRKEAGEVGRFDEVRPGFLHIDVKGLTKLPDELWWRLWFVAKGCVARWTYMSIKSHHGVKEFIELINEVVKMLSVCGPYRVNGQQQGVYG